MGVTLVVKAVCVGFQEGNNVLILLYLIHHFELYIFFSGLIIPGWLMLKLWKPYRFLQIMRQKQTFKKTGNGYNKERCIIIPHHFFFPFLTLSFTLPYLALVLLSYLFFASNFPISGFLKIFFLHCQFISEHLSVFLVFLLISNI